MDLFRTCAATLSLLALSACSTSEIVNQDSGDIQPDLASLDKPASIQLQTFVMRGEVVIGHEVRSITPCSSQKQFWLDLPEERFQQAVKLARTPYAPLYGEVVGHLETKATDGFVSDYTARFVVDHINLLSAENIDRCNQAPQPTKAFGTEPFWALHFANNGLIFHPMGGEKRTLSIRASKIEPNRRRYQFTGGSLELNQRSCVDGMSDSLYGWSSTLILDEKRYTGCATLSNQDATISWEGSYQAQSTESNGFSITLKLNADHSATTTYSYGDGESDSVERGFWQQLSDKQILATMTHHQQQSLLSERLFTRDGNQIKAENERVGNILYPIANGGLMLFKGNSF